MKQVLLLAVLMILIFASGCKHKGCTIPCASNFDSKAEQDDGSCRGCMEPKATNYCPEAIIPDSISCNYNPYLDQLACEYCCDSTAIINNTAFIEGYTNQISYFPNETVDIYISSIANKYTISLTEEAIKPNIILESTQSTGSIQNYNECAFSIGCNWNLSKRIAIPKNAKSGYYSITLKNEKQEFKIPLIIKSNTRTENKILIIASSNTWHAYNTWGGASFYNCEPIDSCNAHPKHAKTLSFNRPIEHKQYENKGNQRYDGHLFGAELGLVHWLEREKYQYSVISDFDLHNNPAVLNDFKIVMLNTHPEYWSESSVEGLENYLNNGGNLCYIGGNGLYWKVELTDDFMECRLDGGKHITDNSFGGKWRNSKLQRNEEKLLGVAYTLAGYKTYMPYEVINDDHWIFDNTNLKNGDLFGESFNNNYASGHETDKMSSLSPANLILLARGLNNEAKHLIAKPGADMNGGAHMIYYDHSGGGAVFSTGSISSSCSMLIDKQMSTVVSNAINRMMGSIPKTNN